MPFSESAVFLESESHVSAKRNSVACGSNLSWLLLIRISFCGCDIPGNPWFSRGLDAAMVHPDFHLLHVETTHIRQEIKATIHVPWTPSNPGFLSLFVRPWIIRTRDLAVRDEVASRHHFLDYSRLNPLTSRRVVSTDSYGFSLKCRDVRDGGASSEHPWTVTR